jgi:hypothetical protein
MQFTFASIMAAAYLVLSVAGSALPGKNDNPHKYVKYVTVTDYKKIYKTETIYRTKWKPTTTTCTETVYKTKTETKWKPTTTTCTETIYKTKWRPTTVTCTETITKTAPPKTVTTTCYETKYKTITKCGDYCDNKDTYKPRK